MVDIMQELLSSQIYGWIESTVYHYVQINGKNCGNAKQ